LSRSAHGAEGDVDDGVGAGVTFAAAVGVAEGEDRAVGAGDVVTGA
jgi:hypothetical protein